jgi:DNA invertase Pin-like site-specific DNA recombinase
MVATPKRMDGYIRVSRVGAREGESYISPDVQREAIERWAEYKGATIAEWHVDEDWSGGTHDRPGLTAAIDRAEAGETGGVVAWKIDRFSRYTEDGLRDLRRLEAAGARLAFVVEDVDTSGPMGRFVYTIMLAMASYFLDTIKGGWIEAKERAIERGTHIGPTPVGYAREDDGRLSPDPEYAPMLTTAFKKAAAGDGDSAIAKWATGKYPRRTGGAAWAPSEVRRWLRSRVYLGEVRYGDALANPNAHKPLTDLNTWTAAQRTPGVRRRNLGDPFPLSGIARCAHCRYAMSGQTSGGAKGKTRVYRCGRGGGGPHSVIVADRLERHVAEVGIAHWKAADPEAVAREYEPADPSQLAALDAKVAEAEAAQRMLTTATDPDADWLADVRAKAADLEAVQAERDEVAERVRQGGIQPAKWVFVRRRPRGASVADRTLVIFPDDPRTFDMPGPHKSGPFPPVTW